MISTATYTKLRSGEWGIRTTYPINGVRQVQVTKKSGETKNEIAGREIWHGNGIYLYTIERSGKRRDSYGNSVSSGASYRAGVTAPHGRVCPRCGSRECAKAWNPHDLCDED